MDRMLSHHTRGIPKKKNMIPQKKKRPIRYFSLEGLENNPNSGSEIISKKTVNTGNIDVTQNLLSLALNKSSAINVESKTSPLLNGNVENSENCVATRKIKRHSLSLQKNKEVSSKEDSCNIGRKNSTNDDENISLIKDLKLKSLPILKINNHKVKIKKKKKSKKTKLPTSKSVLNENDSPSKVPQDIDLSKYIKESVQESGIPNHKQTKKPRKKLGSSREGLNEKQQNEDETKQKHSKTAHIFESASVVQNKRHLSHHPKTMREKSNLSDTLTSSLKLESETKVMDRSFPVKKEQSIPSQVLPQVDVLNGKSSEKGVPVKENVQIRPGKRMSEEWIVQNSDEPMQRNTSPPESPKKSSKIKKKLSSIHIENAGMVNFLPKHQQKANAIETKTKSFEGEAEDYFPKLKISNNNKNTEKPVEETCNSQPIVVEMCGDHNVSSSPMLYRAPAFRKKNVTPKLNLKSDLNWRSPNIHGTEKWEVQYGNTENVHGLGNQNFESESGKLDRNNIVENEVSLGDNNSFSEGGRVIENSCNRLYDIFDISDTEAILAIPPSQSAFFKGALKVKVLVGKISVLGHEINPKSGVCTVYSPYGVSFPGLQSYAKYDVSLTEKYWRHVLDAINSLKRKKSLIKESIFHKVPAFSSIILLEQVSEALLPFLGKYLPVLRFPTAMAVSRVGEDASGTLRALFVDSRYPDEKLYREPSGWDPLIKFLLKRDSGSIRAVACGGKGVGKSTLLRFLTNKTLSKYKEVLYIDFDPGQCEFSIPGCVSATIVRKPLLGPNFTHLTHTERMVYIGEIDVSRCSALYLESVKYIFDWCCSQTHLCHLPWFINTMGFPKGMGVEINVAIIKMINPSDLIQIDSAVWKRNYPFVLNSQNVQNHVVSLHSLSHKQDQMLGYSFHLLPSAAETSHNQSSPWGAQANISRDTVIMSYFSQVVSSPAFSLLEVAPHKLPFSGLKLCISHEKVKFCDYLLAMNANLVGLCDAGNTQSLMPSNPEYPEIIVNPPICHCVGFGIVRGVDLEKRVFYIISPIEPRKLKVVNCLILGSVHLPDSVYTFQDEAQGTIPYVIEGALLPLGRGVRAAKPSKKLF